MSILSESGLTQCQEQSEAVRNALNQLDRMSDEQIVSSPNSTGMTDGKAAFDAD